MEFKIELSSDTVSVTGDMMVYCASDLKPALFEHFAAGSSTVQLDLSQVQEFDTAGLQLLLLLSRDLQGRLRIVACSPTVRAALELTRLNSLLAAVPEAGCSSGTPRVFTESRMR